MTTINLKTEYNGALSTLSVNGKFITCEPRISEIANVSAGRWEGIASGEPFTITGGRGAGGSSRDWFVQWAHLAGEKHIPVSSAVEAVNCIEFV